MEQSLIVTLARLREASELYRQLEEAGRHQMAAQSRARDLAALSCEYGEDLEPARRQERDLRSQARRLEDELEQIELKLQDRRSRRTGNAGAILALADELAALQARRVELERHLLELWQQNEDAARDLEAEQAAADAAQHRLARESEHLAVRCRRADRAVPEITNELLQLLQRLPRQVAGKLEKIAQRYADPVADLHLGACATCGQSLPPQKAVDADREVALVVCQGCGRFIVARSSRRTRGV